MARFPFIFLRTIFLPLLFVLGFETVAFSQQNFLPGFGGLKCGSQSDPGIYVAAYGWRMDVQRVADRKGKEFSFAKGGGIYINSPCLSITGVTKKKILGGNYGYSATGSICNSRLELPRHSMVNQSYSYGITSTYLQPINLGWQTSRADFIVGYAIYLPTGNWTWMGQNNHGLGMWTQEINVGSTFYLDRKKNFHLAVMAFYDINSKKRGISYRTGWPLSLQGGLGANYGNPDKLWSGWFGVAGFAQWITVRTRYDSDLGPIDGPYARIYGLGPEFVALKGALTFRYLWEFGARSNFEGRIWCVTLTFSVWKPKAENGNASD